MNIKLIVLLPRHALPVAVPSVVHPQHPAVLQMSERGGRVGANDGRREIGRRGGLVLVVQLVFLVLRPD